MLTATYSVIAISAEWQSTHGSVVAIEQDILRRKEDPASIDSISLESTIDQLSEFCQRCHSRRLEQYLIPAIRKSTAEAEPLLAELDALKTRGMQLLRALRAGLHAVVEQGLAKVEELCRAMQLYCQTLHQRLRREEQLVQIAQRVIPEEGWFDIAIEFFADHVHYGHAKRHRQQAPPSASNARLAVGSRNIDGKCGVSRSAH